MRKFFIPFYQALSSQDLTLEEVVNKVDYTYTFSIHSFSVKEEPTLKNLEVGILHNLFDDLANFVGLDYSVLEGVREPRLRSHGQPALRRQTRRKSLTE